MKDEKIPKVIHYCWFGGKKIPKEVKKCIRTWKRKCPDFVIKRWDESNVDLQACEFLIQAYQNKAWAFVSDYVRLQIIYKHGGVYLDTDVEILKDLTPLLCHEAYFGMEQKSKLINTGIGFGAKQGHPILKELISLYENIQFDEDIINELACPLLTADIFKKNGYEYSDNIVNCKGFVAYPPEYFDPYGPGGDGYLVCDKTFSIHHYSASWKPAKMRIRRRIVNKLPAKLVVNLKRIRRELEKIIRKG